MATNIQVVGNTLDGTNRLEFKLDGGTTIEVPTIQSEAITENITGDVTGDATGTITTANAAGPWTVDWVDSSGTPGDCTCSSISGKVAIAIGDNEVIVTNTNVAAGDLCFVQKLNNDATLTDFKVVTTSNTITITGNATSTAAVYLHFLVVKANDVTPA